MIHWRLPLFAAAIVVVPTLAMAQQQGSATARPRSPGEIAKESRILAEKNERCRREAKQKELKFLERRRFLRDCVKG